MNAGEHRATVGSNITAMYVLQIANYVIPLLTLPYLLRVLGAEHYGVMAMAYAVVYFLVLFVDAGFNSRAVRLLSCAGNNHDAINEIYAATQWIKLAQSLAGLVVLALLVNLSPLLRNNAPIYFASYMIVVGSLLFPTWLFQGLQIMHFTTLCSVAGRLLATVGIFLLVDSPDDVLIAALLQASATAISGALSLPLVANRLQLTLLVPMPRLLRAVRQALRESWSLGISEYVTTAMANASVFVLGLFASESVVGIYAAIAKVAQAGVNAFQPLLKSLFPVIAGYWSTDTQVAADHSRRWARRIGAAALLCTLSMYALAPAVLETLFGTGWGEHALLMQLLAIWLFLAVISATGGQFWLLARGERSLYSRCLLATGIVQVSACLIGAIHAGIGGVVISMLLAELARLSFFTLALAKRQRGVST